MAMLQSHLEVGHEVSEGWRALLLQQIVQADDQRNCLLYKGFLLNLWTEQPAITAPYSDWLYCQVWDEKGDCPGPGGCSRPPWQSGRHQTAPVEVRMDSMVAV